MQRARLAFGLAVPALLAVTAFLHAKGIDELVAASLVPSDLAGASVAKTPLPVGPVATSGKTADAILDRNPFDHTTGPLRPKGGSPGPEVADDADPLPTCARARARIVVRAKNADESMVAFVVDGKRLVRRRGGEAEGVRVAYVGDDRAWLFENDRLCVSRIFDPAPPVQPFGPTTGGNEGSRGVAAPAVGDTLGIAKKIVRVSPNEFHVDRGAVDKLLEASTELMKVQLTPEKVGDRVVGMRLGRIRPGSPVALLGLQDGDRLESINGIDATAPEKMMEILARLKTATLDRLTIHITRNNAPMNIDYLIR